MGRRIVAQSGAVAPEAAVGAKAAAESAPELSEYWDRLKNLIPAEVSAIYIAGLGVIPHGERIGQGIWALACLAFVIVFMAKQTQSAEGEPTHQYPVDWVHVAISAVSFVIWAYVLGGVFVELGLHVAWLGTLLMLGWTFLIPFIYRGGATGDRVERLARGSA